MNTGCEFFSDALAALAADTLEPERVERVEAHLATCPDCRSALAVIRAVRRAPAPVPEGLEARLQAAARGDAPTSTPVVRLEQRSSPWRSWRPWAVPAAVAAAVALWLAGSEILPPDVPTGEATGSAEVEAEYPYGAWPASNGVVAGEVVLSELSVEELEALLEEMDS